MSLFYNYLYVDSFLIQHTLPDDHWHRLLMSRHDETEKQTCMS